MRKRTESLACDRGSVCESGRPQSPSKHHNEVWADLAFVHRRRRLRTDRRCPRFYSRSSIKNNCIAMSVALNWGNCQSSGTKYRTGMLFWRDKGGGSVMLVTFVGTLLAGTLLGLHFKVLVLVPFILILVCAIIATGDGLKAI